MITLVIRGGDDLTARSATLASIGALHGYSAERYRVVVIAEQGEADPAGANAPVPFTAVGPERIVETLDGLLSSEPTPGGIAGDYVEFCEAGTVFNPGAFDTFVEHTATSNLLPFYVHLERSYRYRLNRCLTRDHEPVVRLDEAERLWVGSTPTLLDAALYRELSAELRDGSSPRLLFFEALLRAERFGVLGGVSSTHRHEDELHGEQRLFTPEWYFGFLDTWITLLERVRDERGEVPLYLQRAFLYLAQFRLQYNADRRDKRALDEAQLREFYERLRVGLGFVDSGEIADPVKPAMRFVKGMSAHMLKAKLGESFAPEIVTEPGEMLAQVGGITVERLSETRIDVDVIDIHDDELLITGRFPAQYLSDQVSLVLSSGRAKVELPDTGVYSEFSVFGIPSHRFPTFRARVPLKQLKGAGDIQIFAVFGPGPNDRTALRLQFRKHNAKLSWIAGSYWVRAGRIFRAHDRSISYAEAVWMRRLKAEMRLQLNLWRNPNRASRAAAALRLVYFLTRPFIGRRRHWIYYDRIVRGGDNSEYAYDYAEAQHDGIRKHYVLGADAPDAARFSREGKRYLAHKTLKHRLLFLNAELVFASHPKPPMKNAFSWNEHFFRDLFNYRLVYLNHGLMLDRLDYVLNKSAENIDRLCVVSPLETKGLIKKSYGYQPHEIVETGFARYDGLVSKPTRQLLLAPTWRYYLSRPQSDDRLQSGASDFTASAYFKVFDGVIGNERLHAGLERYGYRLSFLLHPNTSSQSGDFVSRHPSVEVLSAGAGASYEQLLTESDLMITDYSGVQFDFAFMNKPVVYYHHPSIPPHYSPGTFSYDEHGFGEIAATEDELVDVLLDYMARECEMPERYRARIDSFFAHHDRENSRRVYETARELAESGVASRAQGLSIDEHIALLSNIYLPELEAGDGGVEIEQLALKSLLAIYNDNRKLHSQLYAKSDAELRELREAAHRTLRRIGARTIRSFETGGFQAETRQAWLAAVGDQTGSPVVSLEPENTRGLTRLAFYSTRSDIEFELGPGASRIVAQKRRSVEYLRQMPLYEYIIVAADLDPETFRLTSRSPGFEFEDGGRIGTWRARRGPARLTLRSALGRLRYELPLAILSLTGQTERYRDAWVLADRREQANDNAEVLMRHLMSERPDVNAWFALAKDAPAYQQLRRDGFKLLPYGSMRHLAAMRHATRLVSSQIDKTSMQPFPTSVLRQNWSFTYLKHGVLHTEHFRRYNAKSIDLVVTATPEEDHALAGDGGGYRFTRDEVRLTGMPRHDRLTRALTAAEQAGTARRLLLIAPTWRIYLGEKNPDLTWSVRGGFADTDYVRQWSALINDPRLQQLCEAEGLEAAFLLHPRFTRHAHYFDVPEWMRVANYEQDVSGLIAATRVFVTDYSSLAFEAAYVDAPTVYLQFDREEFFSGGHSSVAGDYDHERQGFGPVTEDAADAADAVVQLVRGTHPRQSEYEARYDGLYPYRDGRACERVTAAIEGL